MQLENPASATKGAPETAAVAPPCVMVIFGASGDLAKRLLVPALYTLAKAGRLSPSFRLVGVATRERPEGDWARELTQAMQEMMAKGGEFEADKIDDAAWRWLTERMSYVAGDLNDAALYSKLSKQLKGLDASAGTAGNYLFYLAIPDRLFSTAVKGLGGAGLTTESAHQWRRVVIEKPFGHDLASARALDAEILETLGEQQVFRIDHFLGKETVQNVMALRFANGLFEPIWNRGHIDHVQITAAETLGVERRGKFYEATGALRDMVPNHLFQLLAMVAMEPPISFEAAAVRAKKAEVIAAIRPMSAEEAVGDAVRGQYVGYRGEPDVAADSRTETFVAMKLHVDNWRWADVPFYLRTGKRLRQRQTEIAIRFHQAPLSIFRGTDVKQMNPNWLVIRIAPEEGIAIEFAAKKPGLTVALETVSMDFSYAEHFRTPPNTGYETLLYDCMTGDGTLFQTAESIEAGWWAVQPLIEAWGRSAEGLAPYEAGSAGPVAADALLARDGRAWRALE